MAVEVKGSPIVLCNVDIHHLKVFVSVFRNRSFTKASSELHLAQPTISSHIKALEEKLDCMLFERLGRTVVPTDEAQLLYSYATGIIDEVEDVKAAIGRLGEEVRGQLIIGASTIPGTYILPSLVSEFKKQYRDISFQVLIGDSGKITDMVLNREIMLGVVGAKMERRKLDYVTFVEDELVLVAPPKLHVKDTITLKELLDIPFILREDGSGTRKTIEKYLDEKGLNTNDLNVTAVFGSAASVKESLRAGLGASIISKMAVTDELKTGTLKEIRIRGLRMARNFYIIAHKKRILPKHYQVFLDYIKRLKKQP